MPILLGLLTWSIFLTAASAAVQSATVHVASQVFAISTLVLMTIRISALHMAGYPNKAVPR